MLMLPHAVPTATHARTQIADKKSEAERETRKRERLEKEARELRASVEQRATEARSKQLEIQAAEEQVWRACFWLLHVDWCLVQVLLRWGTHRCDVLLIVLPPPFLSPSPSINPSI